MAEVGQQILDRLREIEQSISDVEQEVHKIKRHFFEIGVLARLQIKIDDQILERMRQEERASSSQPPTKRPRDFDE